MFYKPRHESSELKILRLLKPRMEFAKQETMQLTTLEKGFEGEQHFDKILRFYSNNWIVLNDLQFEVNNSALQIDSFVITPERNLLFDVKNNEGDHIIKNNKWFKLPNLAIKDPLLQLQRINTLFYQLLYNQRLTPSFESQLAFVNPEFFLYQAPADEPIIFPNQIPQYFNNIQTSPTKLSRTHYTLAEKLVSWHKPNTRFERIPTYTYGGLRKGIVCKNCDKILDKYNNKDILLCTRCGYIENTEAAVMRSVTELKILFPDVELTLSQIYEWCQVIRSKQYLREIMNRNYELVKCGKSSFYQELKKNK